ncbi:hypothetical protein IFO70_32360 [Phormidium tenue FACHB-886]|nr:hypothetical protein [Phormidium tenue FACHB-886]
MKLSPHKSGWVGLLEDHSGATKLTHSRSAGTLGRQQRRTKVTWLADSFRNGT